MARCLEKPISLFLITILSSRCFITILCRAKYPSLNALPHIGSASEVHSACQQIFQLFPLHRFILYISNYYTNLSTEMYSAEHEFSSRIICKKRNDSDVAVRAGGRWAFLFNHYMFMLDGSKLIRMGAGAGPRTGKRGMCGGELNFSRRDSKTRVSWYPI